MFGLARLEVYGKGDPEDEEDREDGCFRVLLQFVLHADQEVLEKLQHSLEDGLGHTLQKKRNRLHTASIASQQSIFPPSIVHTCVG